MKKLLLFLCVAMLFPLIAESQVNWKRTSGPGTGSGINTLFTDEAGFILAGVRGRGIFYSTDGGNNWRQRAMDFKNVLSIAEQKGTDLMYCGVQDEGFFYSENNGSGFIYRSLAGESVTEILVASNGYVWAGTEETGLYKSTDNGLTWTENVFHDSEINLLEKAASGNYYVNSVDSGLHRSTNRGDDWVDLNFEALSVLELESGRIFAGNLGVHYSDDNGESWTLAGMGTSRVLSLLLMDNGHILAGTSKGIYRSTDEGETWVDISNGLDIATDIYDFEISVDSYIYASSEYTSFVFKSNFQFNLEPLYIEVTPQFLQTGKRGTVYSYDVKVTSTGDVGVADADVHIQNLVGGNKTLKLTTDANGEVTYTDTVSQSSVAGTFAIYFRATKTNYQASEELVREYEVKVYNLKLIVNPSAKQEKDYGDSVTYEISMFLNDEAFENADVEVTDGLLSKEETLNTDALGKASYTTWVPKGTPNSTYLIKFRGGTDFYGYTGIEQREIVIEHEGYLILIVNPEEKPTLDWGDSVVYEMMVYDEENEPVAGADINGVDGLLVSQIEIQTEPDGSAQYVAKVPDGLNDGTYLNRFIAIKDDNVQSEVVRRNITVFHEDTVSVSEREAQSVRVYPNPAFNDFNISLNLDEAEDMIIRLISANGDVAMKQEYKRISGERTFAINTQELSRGVYILEMKVGDRTLNRKLILK